MVLKSIGLPAALALAMLSMGCGPADPPAAPPQAPSTASAPATAPATGQAPAAAFDETRAVDMLETRLAADHVYADAQCLQYFAETGAEPAAADAAASPSATAEPAASASSVAIDVAVREKHGEGCPGDPQTAPVRDRYRVERSGAILWYDVAEGDFVGYAQRARDNAGGML